MSGVDGNWFGALAVLLVVVVVDVWIFSEARSRYARGRPVVATVGPVTLCTPVQWLVACLVLWVFVVPLYLVARKA
jgi:hypothetical protein